MRILIADLQPAVRSAVRLLLEQKLELVTVLEAGSKQELLAQRENLRPDIILLDWDLAGGSAVELVSTLRGIENPPRLVVLDAQPESERAALDAGADAFVSKCDPPKRLLATVLGLWAEGQREG